MIPKHIEGANVELAKNQPEFGNLWALYSVEDGYPLWQTAWEPTPAELELLNKGQPVILRVLAVQHPPVMLMVPRIR